MYKIITYIFLAVFIISCNTNNIESPHTGNKEIELEFSFNITSAFNIQTRSYDENSVRCIDVLVFDQNKKFLERIKVNDITGSGNTKHFKIRIQESSDSRIFHFIANARDSYESDIINFDILSEDKLESEIIPKLQTEVLTSGEYIAPLLPMWGREEFSSITYTTQGGNIKLLRSVAALTIECDEPDNENGLNDFELVEATILKTSDRGKIAPDNYTSAATTPSIISNILQETTLIDYMDENGQNTWFKSIENKIPNIYLYEKENSNSNEIPLSLLIKAKYKESLYYYKIWIADSDGNLIDIIRNHRYTIKIIKVNSAGYTNYQDAYEGEHSSNIYVEILDEEDDIMEIVADGTYELGVSSSDAIVYGRGSKNIIKVINTNSSKSPILFSSESWLSALNLSHIRDDLYDLNGNFSSTDQERSADVMIKVENLEKTIRVTQKPGEGTINASTDTIYLSASRPSSFIELTVENNASWEVLLNTSNVASASPDSGTGNEKIEFSQGNKFGNSTYTILNKETQETKTIYVCNLNLNIPDTIWVEGAAGTANLPPEMTVAQGGDADWLLGEVYCVPDLYTPSEWLTNVEKIDLNGNGKYRLQLQYTLGAATDKRQAYLPISHINDPSYIKRVVVMQEQTTVELEGDYLFFELDYENVTYELSTNPLLTYARPFVMFEMINGDIPTILDNNSLSTLNKKPLGYGTGGTASTEAAGEAHFTRSIRKDAEGREIFYWSGSYMEYTKYEGFYIHIPNLLTNFSDEEIDIIFDFYAIWTINKSEDPVFIKIKGYNDGILTRTVIREINTDENIPGNWPGFYTFQNDGGYLTFQGIYRKKLLNSGSTNLSKTFRESYTKIARIIFNTKTKKTKINFAPEG